MGLHTTEYFLIAAANDVKNIIEAPYPPTTAIINSG
jgi:hypothetical protein